MLIRVLNIEHPNVQEQVIILIDEVDSKVRVLLSAAAAAVLTGAIGITVTQTAWAKNLPMGHPSLILQLRAGDDSRFDFFIPDEESMNVLDDEVANRVGGIIERFVLPEIKKQFDEKNDVYSDGYIEYISVNYRVDQSRLEILIAKQPEDYGCDTEGCHVMTAIVDVPAELKLSQIGQVSMFIAVYETPDTQLVDRIQSKALTEARMLLSAASDVIQEKKSELIADQTPIEWFFLRQYEDISRVTLLFTPFEPGGLAKEPIDVVDTSNTYYDRVYSDSNSTALKAWPPAIVTEYSPGIRNLEVGDNVVVTTTFTNNDDFYDWPASFIIEIRDANDTSVLLDWQTGMVKVGSSIDVGISWIPQQAGTYQLRTFAISSFDTPTILSPISSSEVTVFIK